jgi:hypothetical protein
MIEPHGCLVVCSFGMSHTGIPNVARRPLASGKEAAWTPRHFLSSSSSCWFFSVAAGTAADAGSKFIYRTCTAGCSSPNRWRHRVSDGGGKDSDALLLRLHS